MVGFRKKFDWSDFLVDFVIALLATLVSFAIDKKMSKKIKKIVDIVDADDVTRYLNELMGIIVSVDAFGQNFTLAFNLSPAFVQKVVEVIMAI